ncbi:MAG: hypothetical protein ACI8UO_006461 [Verrucomicrobiales bacterium]|jgi:hypothetical protein
MDLSVIDSSLAPVHKRFWLRVFFHPCLRGAGRYQQLR